MTKQLKAEAAVGKTTSPAAKPTKSQEDISVYQVFRDKNGVCYLRVGQGKKSAQFVVNKGFSVELVALDEKSAKGLALEAVAGASVIDAAKRLLNPVNSSIVVSTRSSEHLNSILQNKEITEMETATKAANRKPKFAATSAPAAKGSKAKGKGKGKAKANGERASRIQNVLFKFKAQPKGDAKLPPQAQAILDIIEKKKQVNGADLVAAMEGKVETKQTLGYILSYYKPRLLENGYVTVTEVEAEK